ncbi:MAG TPA: hypothetical protein DIU15_18085, partial [Deltaproteobacteria bacterium]|nr:hypothetical protein [Deltaproteobacteria bacterium]
MPQRITGAQVVLMVVLGTAALGCGDGHPESEEDQDSLDRDLVTCSGDYLVDGIATDEDLRLIANCREITGNLSIEDTSLTQLDEPAGLESVGGSLSIVRNASLGDLDGLSRLTSVDGDLLIGWFVDGPSK